MSTNSSFSKLIKDDLEEKKNQNFSVEGVANT